MIFELLIDSFKCHFRNWWSQDITQCNAGAILKDHKIMCLFPALWTFSDVTVLPGGLLSWKEKQKQLSGNIRMRFRGTDSAK